MAGLVMDERNFPCNIGCARCLTHSLVEQVESTFVCVSEGRACRCYHCLVDRVGLQWKKILIGPYGDQLIWTIRCPPNMKLVPVCIMRSTSLPLDQDACYDKWELSLCHSVGGDHVE
ncbi:hypothetical protein VNO77_03714 [Canavalia gladiata]|uniref:Uncharacterized protein n=1 Tax=Canavalia gladiata TaxID=3824 RepID=A0AAN9N1M9_CANGL